MEISLSTITKMFRNAGATRILAKPLVNNDNSKQQIYLGGSFEVLKAVPFGAVVANNSVEVQNFKAPVSLYWLTESGDFEPARHSKLILYPKYPEVRLSGFLRGCSASPSKHMQPVPISERLPGESWDGRVLLLGTTADGKVLAALASANSVASSEFDHLRQSTDLTRIGVLYEIPVRHITDTRLSLLNELRRIKDLGWVDSIRLNKFGQLQAYNARNGGGYTLEAMLGIKPNGRSEPDFLGWEVKVYGGDRVTLMTPEPDGGYYGLQGTEAFLRKYGYRRSDDVIYFTGIHKVGRLQEKTGQTLSLDGFDPETKKITNVNGGITLVDEEGNPAAIWTYCGLISHWGRKHANAAYIPYEKREPGKIEYRYLSPASLGVGTDFTKYLNAMQAGMVVYDPGPKLTDASSDRSRVKARSQFRISVKNLSILYEKFEDVAF
jgi:hypothetical protein